MSINKFGLKIRDSDSKTIENVSNFDNLMKSSGDTMTGTLNMNQNKIVNLGDPIEANDAVHRLYVYRADKKLRSDVKSETKDMVMKHIIKDADDNVNMKTKRILHLGNPINDYDAATKIYVDSLRASINQPINLIKLKVPPNEKSFKHNLILKSTKIDNLYLLYGTVEALVHINKNSLIIAETDNLNCTLTYNSQYVVMNNLKRLYVKNNKIYIDTSYIQIPISTKIEINTLIHFI